MASKARYVARLKLSATTVGRGDTKQWDDMWREVLDDAHLFNQAYNHIQRWLRAKDIPLAVQADKELWNPNLSKKDPLYPTAPYRPMGQWALRFNAIDRSARRAEEQKKRRAESVFLGAAVHNKPELPEAAKDYVKALGEYAKYISHTLAQAGPRDFKYQGFRVVNPARLPHESTRKLLGGLDYIVALFKRRGVQKLLQETVQRVFLRPQEEGESAHGVYRPKSRQVDLIYESLSQSGGRILKDWVGEVFLHEIGHHVHLYYLHPEAKKVWDSGWDSVSDAREKQEKSQEQAKVVSHKDRKRYWQHLVRSRGNLRNIKLKGLDRLKFHQWLKEPMMGGPLVTDKQLRWSQRGRRHLSRLFIDPERFLVEIGEYNPAYDNFDDILASSLERQKDMLGVLDTYAPYNHPHLTDEQVKGLSGDLVSEAIEALQTPTWYAKTNFKEDFAETFVAFMAAPERLSDVASFRMKQALSLSGLYGKPVMRLSSETSHILSWVSSHGDPLTLYREVLVSHVNELNYDKLGRYWTPNRKKARSPFGTLDGKGPLRIVLQAQAPRTAVDEFETVATLRRYPDEQEIRLHDNARVKLEGYWQGSKFTRLGHPARV